VGLLSVSDPTDVDVMVDLHCVESDTDSVGVNQHGDG